MTASSGSPCSRPIWSAGSIPRPATSSSSPRRPPKSRPYGMAVNSKNVVHFVEFGANKIATIDAQDHGRSRNTHLPDPGARPRRIAITPDDRSGTPISRAAILGRLDPASRQGRANGLAERPEIAALRHRLHQGRALVQRIRRQAEHHRALRSEDGEIPELGDPRRRRHRAQHGCDATTATRSWPTAWSIRSAWSRSRARPIKGVPFGPSGNTGSIRRVRLRANCAGGAGKNSNDDGYTVQWCRMDRHRAHPQPHRGWDVLYVLGLPQAVQPRAPSRVCRRTQGTGRSCRGL